MSQKQLVALFVSQLAPYTMANMLLSLLPIYVRRLGADATVTGFYLALIFAALAIGTLSSGWLSAGFQRHKLFVVWANILSAPAAFLMGQADNIIALTLLTCIVWFLGGIQLTLANILTGIQAEGGKLGRSFGVIGVAPVVGGLLGGLVAGPIVEHAGFQALFLVSALLYVLVAPATLLLEERSAVRKPSRKSAPPIAMSTGFLLLLSAGILVSVANFITGLGRPLVMDRLDFAPTAISSTIAVSSAVNLPLPFLMGWLSDRLGRRPVLVVCYLAVAMGIAILGMATTIWHFWVSQILVSFVSSERVIGSALVTDTVHPSLLSSALSRFAAAPWLGAVIGYAFSGVAFQLLGMSQTLFIGMLLPLVAILLVSTTYLRQRAFAV